MLKDVPKGGTLHLSGPKVYEVKKNISLPRNLAVKFENGAVLAPSEGVRVKILGPIEAGIFQIFSGAGQIELGPSCCREVYPQWWGANDNGKEADSTTKALQSALDSGHRVYIPPGTYLSNKVSLSKPGVVVQGAGKEQSVLLYNDPHKGSFFNLNASFVKLQDLKIQGKTSGIGSETTGVLFEKATRSQLNNIRIQNFSYGVRLFTAWGNNVSHCYIYQNPRAGIYLESGAHAFSVTDGTEIAGSAFGLFLGRFRNDPFDVDYSFRRVAGQMVSVSDSIIEGIHAVDGKNCKKCVGGVGVYSSPGAKGINISSTYFEDLKVAYQLGSEFTNDGLTPQTGVVLNPTFTGNFLSNVTSAIKVGRILNGDFSNNYGAGVQNMFDTDGAKVFQDIEYRANSGYKSLFSKPGNVPAK